MIAKYLPAVFVVAALGCAQSTTQTQPVAAVRNTTPKTTLAAKPRELRSANIAQSMQPLANTPHVVVSHTKEGGVGLTGPEHTYVEQVDPSGWSGRSAPPAPEGIGGGPAAEGINGTTTGTPTKVLSDEQE